MAKKAYEEDPILFTATSAVPEPDDWLSSGSTILNLACSGHPMWALAKGKYFWMVGDSSSGKTFLTLTCLAEASISSRFDNYDLIFDNAEDGALMEVEKYYGPRLAARMRPPWTKDGAPRYSKTVEDFLFGVQRRLEDVIAGKCKPFIWLLDSIDALSSEYEVKRVDERIDDHEKGKELKGEMTDGKAKVISQHMRHVVSLLPASKCIVIVLSQTRDKMNAGIYEKKTTHAGGKALKFYATWQLWSSRGGTITTTIHGNKRQQGIYSRIRIEKNRLTGKEWEVELPLYWSTGIDNTGSMVDFLLEEKHWKKSKDGIIDAEEIGIEGDRDEVIAHIERNDMELDVQSIVVGVWKDIEEKCKVERKSRYS